MMHRRRVITLTLGFACVLFTCNARAQNSAALQAAFDCNSNGIDDSQDIAAGTSTDCNQNGSPDECDVLTGSGSGFPSDVRIDTATASGGLYANRYSILPASDRHRRFAWAVGGGGDFNGDGIDDVIIGEPVRSGIPQSDAWIVFGKRKDPHPLIDASTFDGTNGVELAGKSTPQGGPNLGFSVDSIGDFNGDEIDDVVSTAESESAVAVLFGSSQGFPPKVLTSQLDGTNGFSFSLFNSINASGIGDVNHDGYDDIGIVGRNQPFSCVLFGRASPVPSGLQCAGATTDGFGSLPATRIAPAGDLNRDGIDDFLLGLHEPYDNYYWLGEAYVVYGTTNSIPWYDRPTSFAALDGQNGFLIRDYSNLALPSPHLGFSVAGDFDVNGDGIDDFMVSEPNWMPLDPNSNGESIAKGAVYVVYGNTTGVLHANTLGFPALLDLAKIDGTNGFKMIGGADTWQLGFAVASAGDVNADGYDDLLLNSLQWTFGPFRTGLGWAETHLILGRPTFPAILEVDNTGEPNAMTIVGLALEDVPNMIAAVGDVNSDGFDDFAVTSPHYEEVTIVFGRSTGDCNLNGVLDGCDVQDGTSPDINANTIPDECDSDCNGNFLPDDYDIVAGTSTDCNSNGRPDECDLLRVAGRPDCNNNGILDACEIAAGTSYDCNENQLPDICDFWFGNMFDCQGNGIGDECEIAAGSSSDCNTNGRPDECDIAGGVSIDSNGNGIPDACEPMMLFGIDDYDQMANCSAGPLAGTDGRCDCFDFDASGAVDLLDFAILSRMIAPEWRVPTGCCFAWGKSAGQQNLAQLAACLTGPGGTTPPGCECFDVDTSGTVDLRDYAEFILAP